MVASKSLVVFLLGVLCYQHRHLLLLVPNYGFLLYALSGESVPPYFDQTVWKHPENTKKWLLRPNERNASMQNVLVCGCAKCGTTMTLQIIHKIRMKGEDLGKYEGDILLNAAPWFEYKQYPSQTVDERVVAYYSVFKNPGYDFQVFKSHEAPPMVPIIEGAKYVVMFRNPLDSLGSLYNMVSNINPSWIKFNGGFGNGWTKKATFYEGFFAGSHPFYKTYVNYAEWLKYCHKKNVLCLHFKSMRQDFAKGVNTIIDFLDVGLTSQQREAVMQHSTLKFMKANNDRYNADFSAAFTMFARKDFFVRDGKVDVTYQDAEMEGKKQVFLQILKEELSAKEFDFIVNGVSSTN